MTRELSLVCAGALAALAFMLSCGDESAPAADAAACDCPQRTIVLDVVEGAGDTVGLVVAIARCPPSFVVIGGGCDVDLGQGGAGFRLVRSGGGVRSGEQQYLCAWYNEAVTSTTVTAWASCQYP